MTDFYSPVSSTEVVKVKDVPRESAIRLYREQSAQHADGSDASSYVLQVRGPMCIRGRSGKGKDFIVATAHLGIADLKNLRDAINQQIAAPRPAVNKNTKVRLVADCYELTARKNAIDKEGNSASGEWLGFVEEEGRGAAKWSAYRGNGELLGKYRSPYVAAAKLVAVCGLGLGQVKKPRTARFTVRIGRKIIGSIDDNGQYGWTWRSYGCDEEDMTYYDKAGALQMLVKAYVAEIAADKAARRAEATK